MKAKSKKVTREELTRTDSILLRLYEQEYANLSPKYRSAIPEVRSLIWDLLDDVKERFT